MASSAEALLRAAVDLCSEKGFEGVSVKEIAEEAGVNPALINYHFGSKEGLYRSCVESFGKKKLKVVQRVLTKPKDAQEFRLRIQLFAEEMIESYLEDPKITKIIHRECDLQVPFMEEVFNETFFEVFQTLVRFIEAGKALGTVKSELEPRLVALFFFGLIVHVTRMDSHHERLFKVSLADTKYKKKVLGHLESVFLNGILK